MTDEKSVLEGNLERLFARAYVPVEPSAAFRARLLAAVRSRTLRAPRSRFPVAVRIAAAAAVAAVSLGAGIVLWRSAKEPARSLEELLAGGAAAVQEDPSEGWRPLREDEVRSGIRLATPRLDLATPAEHPATIRIGAADRLELAPASRVALVDDAASGLEVALDHGSLVLEHAASPPDLRLLTPDGTIRLDHGAIELACLESDGHRSTRALLRSGAATALVEPPFALVVGSPIGLSSGTLLADRGLDAAAASADGRTGAATSVEPEPPVAAAPAEPAKASLRGRISAGDGVSLPKALVVTLLRAERLPEVSQPKAYSFEGETFAIDGLAPGTYTVFVRADGAATWQRAGVELVAGAEPVDLQVLLDRGASLRGRVLDPEGRPLEGATVLSERDTPSQLIPFTPEPREPIALVATTTGADGSFELGPLSNGRQRLRASHAGYGAAWSEPVELPRPASEPPAEIVLRLVRPGTIEGQVSRDDGSPWPGAIVVASWLDASASYVDRPCLHYGIGFADATGRYEIGDLPPGLFVVLNVMEGQSGGANRVPRVQQVRIDAGARVKVDLPGGHRGASVEGTILSSDGKPLGGSDVTVLPEKDPGTGWKSTRSRDDGRFDFPSLAPGRYLVFAGGNLGSELAYQGEIEVPDVPVFRPVVRAGSGRMRGRVSEAETGRGLTTSVLVLETDFGRGLEFAGRIVTDAEGRYALSLLPPGKYRVTAYATVGRLGHETADAVEVDASGEAAVCDFALRPGAAIAIRVHDEGGRPLESAKLEFRDPAGNLVGFSPEDRTDPKGEVLVRGAKPGRWTLRVTHPGFETSETVFDLAVGEERAVDVQLRPVR